MANCVRSCWFDRACRNTRHRMVASSPLRNRSSVITLKRRQADPARNVRDNLHMLLFGTLPRRCAMPCRPRRHIAQSDRGSMTSRFDEWLPIENMHLPTLVTRREAMKRKWRHLRRWPPLIPGVPNQASPSSDSPLFKEYGITILAALGCWGRLHHRSFSAN